MPALRPGEQHPAPAEPQQLPLGTRRYRRGQSRHAAVADSLHDPGFHELSLDERLRPQHLHGNLWSECRSDALRRGQTPHGGPPAEAAEPHRRPHGGRIRERHPHRHRAGLSAGALCRRSGRGGPQYGRSLPRPARPGRGALESGIDQPGRSGTTRKSICE